MYRKNGSFRQGNDSGKNGVESDRYDCISKTQIITASALFPLSMIGGKGGSQDGGREKASFGRRWRMIDERWTAAASCQWLPLGIQSSSALHGLE